MINDLNEFLKFTKQESGVQTLVWQESRVQTLAVVQFSLRG